MFSPSQHAELLNELDSNSDEDALKLKERVSHGLLSCCVLVVLGVCDVTVTTSDSFVRKLRVEIPRCVKNLDVFSLM